MQEGNAQTLPPVPVVLPPEQPPPQPPKRAAHPPFSMTEEKPVAPAPQPQAPFLTPPPLPDVTRAALLLPLSGANAKLAGEMLNAAQLAVFDFADERFEMVLHDTGGTPEGAADAATLAAGDGASILVGPLLSASVKAVSPVARAVGLNVIAFSSDRSVAGNGTFTLGFLPSAEVDRVVRFAHFRGITRFAAFVPDTVYGRAVAAALHTAVEATGAAITREQFYSSHTTDFNDAVKRLANYDARRQALLDQRNYLKKKDDEISRRALARLKNLQTIGDLPFDALLLAEGGKRLQAIAALLPFYDVDPAKVRMLGTGQWDEPGIGAEPALLGGWYAAPPPRARADFQAQYKKTYGNTPPRLATLAYDAMALAAVLARAENGPDFSISALTTPSGFFGRDGIFRFVHQGVAERGLAVLEIGARDSRVVGKPPEAFGQAMY